MTEGRAWIGNILTIAVILGLFGAVYFLPPDTSLSEMERAGIIRACVPPDYPPLVTGNAEQPGLEVELLQLVAERLGTRLVLSTNSMIGRDFNPRNWRVTRAQCQVIAGGVVATTTTRSFLDTTPPHLETGWVVIAGDEEPDLQPGMTVGFYAGLSGRDRLALSRYFRERGVTARPISSRAQFVSGIADGTLDAGVTEGLVGRQIAGENDWQVAWLPEYLGRDPIAFGLWKGDLTLKRAMVAILDDLRDEGIFDALIERYEIAPIERTLDAETPA